MNVYQMYVANGNRAGFWVSRDTWGRTIARIVAIDGRAEGELAGSAPYFRRQAVLAEFYSYEGEQWIRKADWGQGEDGRGLGEFLRCAGTYRYSLLESVDLAADTPETLRVHTPHGGRFPF